MIYLTYNDLPSGIYKGQVIDVCSFMKQELNASIRLVAFFSIRNFFTNRKKVKRALPDAIIIPMFPKHKNWKYNVLLLKIVLLIIGKQKTICRGIFATNIALELKKTGHLLSVIFDARGAYKFEFEEYLNNIVILNDSIEDLERKAIKDSDLCLAVSHKLVDYWTEIYNYKEIKHIVIPCTLNRKIGSLLPMEQILRNKRELNYKKEDIIIIYSGSDANWQSAKLMDLFFLKQLTYNKNLKIILLSNFKIEEFASYKEFPNRIMQKWVEQEDVHKYLSISDYGIIIRENSITNKVASPTKFAEYLNAGLKIIISENIGDFSPYTIQHNAGIVVKHPEEPVNLCNTSYLEKQRMNALAVADFTKNTFKPQYFQLIK